MNSAVAATSRYIPIVQQPYCCVAACFLMVMLRHKIPLIAQESLAYELGLIVPKEKRMLFAKVRTGKRPKSGYGTQIQKPEYAPDKIFSKLKIPLRMRFLSGSSLQGKVSETLSEIVNQNGDALVCFDAGKLYGTSYKGGHVCVVDAIDVKRGLVRLVDPSASNPKWRDVAIAKLERAMNIHGDENMCGIWQLYKKR